MSEPLGNRDARATVESTGLPGSYAPEMLMLEYGKGVYLKDSAGARYLDFGAGIAVNALGYGRKDLAKIAAKQMQKLVHVSNLYATAPGLRLASRIIEDANAHIAEPAKLVAEQRYAAVHFGNSGTEANEAALKFARLHSHRSGRNGRRLVSLSNGFHGRTMGSLSVTPKAKYREPYEPLVPDTHTIAFNDISALKDLDESVAGVIVEVVQGEGGLNVMSTEFAAALNAKCRDNGIVLIADEVQTGLGRLGPLFGSEAVGLLPDVITLSKPLGGGLPLSATIITARINDMLKVGDHGSTFGGGPVTTAVGRAVWNTVRKKKFAAAVQDRAAQLQEGLDTIAAESGGLFERKGLGMLQGLSVQHDDAAESVRIAREVRQQCQGEGLLILTSAGSVLRIAPPLIIKDDALQKGLTILRRICRAAG